MAYEQIENKKFLDSAGVGHLWEKIKNRYDSKLDSVTAKDNSISVTNGNQISVVISAAADNLLELKTGTNPGLYVGSTSSATDTYSMVKDADSGDYAAVYHLQKFASGSSTGVNMGVDINIPKDMVVSSGTVVTFPEAGTWGNAGTYIELTLANSTSDKLYIPVDNLIEYVTSGSSANDMVVISIDNEHRVTAAITDDSITLGKLAPAVREAIAAANAGVQTIEEGSTNGTISVDGTDVAVHGLSSAAYADISAFDANGAAAAVLGSDTDTAATATVYGVKQYASDVYSSIMALTNAEIDAAVAAANT